MALTTYDSDQRDKDDSFADDHITPQYISQGVGDAEKYLRQHELENRENGAYDDGDSEEEDSEDSGGSPGESGNSKRSKPSDINNAEKAAATGAGAENATNLSDTLGNGFNPLNRMNAMQNLAQFVGRNKKGGAIGGAIGLIGIVSAIMGFGGVTDIALVNLMKDIAGYESKVEQRVEKKEAQNLLGKMMCRAVSSPVTKAALNCNNKDDPEEGKDKASEGAEEADVAQADGESLAKNMDDFDFTNPDVVTDLAKNGIKVNIVDDKFDGLTDATTDTAITADDIANDDSLFSRFESSLPEWAVGQEEAFRPLMVDHAGAKFSGIEKNDNEEVDKDYTDEVTKGADPEDIAAAEAEDKHTDTQNETPADQQIGAQTESTAATDSEVLSDANKGIAAGESEAEVEAAAESDFHLGSALFLSTIAQDVCSVKAVADNASGSRVPTIIKLLIRHWAVLAALAGQIQAGNITSNEVSQIMNLFLGDGGPAALVTTSSKGQSETTANEAAIPFTRSAAFLRSNGNASSIDPNKQDVNTFTPDIASSALPQANAGTKIVDEIQNIFNEIPGANFGCAVENSWEGAVINGLAGAVQLVADGFSFGATQAAATTAIVAVQVGLQQVVIPDIVQYFTPVGINGHENSVQLTNNTDAGANLSYNDYARRIGGKPMTKAEADVAYSQANQAQKAEFAALPWTTRTFSISNPQSLVSRMAMDMPFSRTQSLVSFANYFSSIPSIIAHDFSSIFFSHFAFADATTGTNPGDPYGITQYGFDNSDLDKYDPVANEVYLNTTVSWGGKTMKRIDLAGNPMSAPDGSDDQNPNAQNDLLHCFTQSFSNTTDPKSSVANQGSPDAICGTEGSYDITKDAPTPMTDTNVATAYCDQLASGDSSCPAGIQSQLHDDIGHYRQYMLDTHIMGDYKSLTDKQ